MEFLGIHELSVEFDIPARVLRYKFLQLIQSGKLVEGQDYRRDDFVDDQHFIWKINPMSFMRETGYQLVNKSGSSVTKAGSQPEYFVTNPDNKVFGSVIKTVNQSEPIVNHEAGLDNHNGNQVGNKMDTKKMSPAPPSLEREIIDLLKGQIVVKDGQIHELTEHNKKSDDLNLKLIGTTVQQAEQIRNLLRLTGGKTNLSEMATKEGERHANTDAFTKAKNADSDNQSVNEVDNNAPGPEVKTTETDTHTGGL